ncbi:MAG: hypothetical protein HQL45_15600 [Alphaproteobacteria bacterium]|nr:hypothetical protein [Alphaproteobacteria bacterium]
MNNFQSACFIGPFFDKLLYTAFNMAQNYFGAVSDLCLYILVVWFSIFAVWKCGFAVMGKGFDPQELFTEFFAIIMASSALKGASFLWDGITTLMYTGYFFAFKAVSGSNIDRSGSWGNLYCESISMLYNDIYIGLVSGSLDDVSLLGKISGAFYALLIAVAAFALIFRVIKHMAEPLFGLLGFLVLMPILVTFSGIAPLRKAAWEGYKYFTTQLLSLVVCAGAVGIISLMIHEAMAPIQPMDNGLYSGEQATWLGGPQYVFTLIAIVIMVVAFEKIMEAPTVIMQSFQSHVKMSLSRFFK